MAIKLVKVTRRDAVENYRYEAYVNPEAIEAIYGATSHENATVLVFWAAETNEGEGSWIIEGNVDDVARRLTR